MRFLRPPVGACLGMPVEVFFPAVGAIDGYAQAAEVCSRCTVIAACLEYTNALESRGALSGIHGFAAGQRHTERRATRTAKPGP